MECLNCGKPVRQTPGKRAKKYCDADCRQRHWLKKKKEIDPPTRGPGRPKKEGSILVYPNDVKEGIEEIKFVSGSRPHGARAGGIIPDLETALASSVQYDPNASFDIEKVKTTLADEPKKWQEAEMVESEIKLPTKPYDLKKMAEAGVPDKEAFKKHVEATKMTPGERSMIYSKLKP